MNKEKTEDRRIQPLSLELSHFQVVFFLQATLFKKKKKHIYLFYLNNNIVTTKRTSASLDRATSYFFSFLDRLSQKTSLASENNQLD